MDQTIKNILKKLEDNGFEAYIVGGYVRDYLLHKKTNDVDIITNALLKDITKLFPNGKCDGVQYGSYKIKVKNYTIDITTYREENKYFNRRPTEINYVNNLLTDLNRRDFTINTLCMNRKGIVVDLLDGKKDIQNKIIKVVGNIKTKFTEDPLRMLRALRFAIVLDFKIEDDALSFIINNKNLIKTLSYQRKKNELNLILISNNYAKGLSLLKSIGVLETLEINYANMVKTDDLLGMWAQLEYPSKYPFTKEERKSIGIIQSILEYGKIDSNMLFKYNLYHNYIAGDILGFNKVIVNKMYKLMPIHEYSDIDIKGNEILENTSIDKSQIKIVMESIKDAILNKKLKNKKKEIIKYINESKW